MGFREANIRAEYILPKMVQKWMMVVLGLVIIVCMLWQQTKALTPPIKEGKSGAVAYYVLNLKYIDKGDDHLKSIQNNVSSAETIDGFDGYSLKSDVINAMQDESAIPNIQKRYGEGGYASKAKKRDIGRYLTHFQLYKRLLTDPGSLYAVVIENTVSISAADINQSVINGIRDAKNEFDVLFLTPPEKANRAQTAGDYGKTCPVDPDNVPTAQAYVINVKNRMNLAMATKTIEETIDTTLAKAIKEGKLKARQFCPPLVQKLGK